MSFRRPSPYEWAMLVLAGLAVAFTFLAWAENSHWLPRWLSLMAQIPFGALGVFCLIVLVLVGYRTVALAIETLDQNIESKLTGLESKSAAEERMRAMNASILGTVDTMLEHRISESEGRVRAAGVASSPSRSEPYAPQITREIGPLTFKNSVPDVDIDLRMANVADGEFFRTELILLVNTMTPIPILRLRVFATSITAMTIIGQTALGLPIVSSTTIYDGKTIWTIPRGLQHAHGAYTITITTKIQDKFTLLCERGLDQPFTSLAID